MQFELLKKYPELSHGISKKNYKQSEIFAANRKTYLNQQGLMPTRIAAVKQEHGNKVLYASLDEPTATFHADALFTDKPNIFLTINVADCYPIFVYDPVNKIAGLAHAGWRGITKQQFCNLIDSFVLKFNSEPQNIMVSAGPGIAKCHFEIQDDVLDNFKVYEDAIFYDKEKIFVDLPGILKKQILDRGVLLKNLQFSGLCTYCEEDLFFSRRRQKESDDVMMVYIGITE